jgi:DNA-binding LacI/PurR family transcriptional regulator
MDIRDDIRNFLKTVQRNRTWFARKAGLSQATISRILSGIQTEDSLTDETKYKIYGVIDGDRGKGGNTMDERFAERLLEQITKLTKELGEVIDENRKISQENRQLVQRILERESQKTVNGK